MRVYLLLMLCFVLTVWSGHAAATDMAHCQTHSAQSEAVKISATTPHSATIFVPVTADFRLSNTSANDVNVHVHAADSESQPHACCDEQNSVHQCGSDCAGCASCQGCGTLHGAAMPVVWQMTPAITQLKIQHLAYSYLNLQPATQERPPKRC